MLKHPIGLDWSTLHIQHKYINIHRTTFTDQEQQYTRIKKLFFSRLGYDQTIYFTFDSSFTNKNTEIFFEYH